MRLEQNAQIGSNNGGKIDCISTPFFMGGGGGKQTFIRAKPLSESRMLIIFLFIKSVIQSEGAEKEWSKCLVMS